MDANFRSRVSDSSNLSRAPSTQSLYSTPNTQMGYSTPQRGATPISQDRASSSRTLQLNRTQQRSCTPDSSNLSRATSTQSLYSTPNTQMGNSTPQRGATPILQDRSSRSCTLQMHGTQSRLSGTRVLTYLPNTVCYREIKPDPIYTAPYARPQRTYSSRPDSSSMNRGRPPAPLRQDQVPRSTPNRNATLTSQERASSTHRSRDPLEEQLRNYTLDTISYFKTVKTFVATKGHWNDRRTEELGLMSSYKCIPITERNKQLEKNLELFMWDTHSGLEQLQIFLDAVERLAVTSPYIFHNETCLLKGVDAKALQSVIVMARIVSPILIVFKRDAQAFFQPKLDNLEVLCQQLATYIDCTEELCRKIFDNPSPRFQLDTTGARQITSDHLRELSKIRKDESFRLMYLFGVEHANMFIDVYNECESEMEQFLSDLEKAAAKLDSLKTGSRISNITGGTIGVLGGALAIAGLALTPVTFGTSMALTFAGVGLGVASGATGISTGVAKMVVRKKQGKKANYAFEHFKEDVEKILNCLHQIAVSLPSHVDEGNLLFGTGKVAARAASMGNGIRKLVGAKKAVGAVAGNSAIYRALPKAAGVMGLAVNFLFIGLDLVTVIRESAKLAKGKKSKEAQLIYSRTALWRSEKNGWDKICVLLTKEKVTFQSKLEILEQPVYHLKKV